MAGVLDRAYARSPVWAQQSAVSIWGAWWYWRRYGGGFNRLFRAYRERESWSAEQFRAYQEGRLRAILVASKEARHYGELYRKRRADLAAPPFEVLESLPLLAKDVLRAGPKELLTAARLPVGTLVMTTSGTTGSPTRIYYTLEFHRMTLAVSAARCLAWAGVHYRARRVMFGSRKVCSFEQDRPPFWRYSPIENLAYASVHHLSARFLPHYLRFLREYRPEMIMGQPSALSTVARYALEHKDFPAPAKAVFTTAEAVSDQARQVIESAWKCRVSDQYGASEGCVWAAQCEHGRYHVSPEVGIVEILDRNGKRCSPGELGEVVCTGLQNELQPLIRYRIGDAARWAIEQSCPCGRSMPILERIEGRCEDACVTSDGRPVIRFDPVFRGLGSVKEAQVIQEEPDFFRVLVVPTVSTDEALVARTITERMSLHVGVKTRIEVRTVQQIPRTPSGKFQAVVCRLNDEEKRRLLEDGY